MFAEESGTRKGLVREDIFWKRIYLLQFLSLYDMCSSMLSLVVLSSTHFEQTLRYVVAYKRFKNS